MTDSQKAHLLAGLAGCDTKTAQRHLRGEAIKGAHLRERLARATKRVNALALEQQDDGASPLAPQAA